MTFARFNKVSDLSYLIRWTILGIIIGSIAGGAAIAFTLGVQFFTTIFLGMGADFIPPSPSLVVSNLSVNSAGQVTARDSNNNNGSISIVLQDFLSLENITWWMIPMVTSMGGLIVGLILTRLAPEAEGHGTDAVIGALHKSQGKIRARIPFVKGLASSITLGSGGSGGTEGPVAQISAGLASKVGDLFKLNDNDRRLLVISGMAAGIGSIFKIPLGAAVFSSEVLYRRDFEVRALVPSIIASVVGYSVFSSVFGWSHLFVIPTDYIEYNRPDSLILYAILGLVCAGASTFYVRVFYKIKELFDSWRSIPKFVRPAIGGALVGVIALLLPQVLGTGYGWLQFALYGQAPIANVNDLSNTTAILLLSLLALVIAKIVATSLTIGSGGSAGVFGPSIVIGGFIGALVGLIFHFFGLFLWIDISATTVVGMIAFFSAAAKTPISSIIMGSEMTGGYTLLAPIMLATVIAYVASGQKNGIFKNQLATRADSQVYDRG
ncbi:MAG: chloride channel protein [Thermoproteota archaeon]|nr:chloride channel protein [Thermoproteota archaeon]